VRELLNPLVDALAMLFAVEFKSVEAAVKPLSAREKDINHTS
jgi:hypothetical protein